MEHKIFIIGQLEMQYHNGDNFEEAIKRLRGKGWIVRHTEDVSFTSYGTYEYNRALRKSIESMASCDQVVLHPSWKQNKICRELFSICIQCAMPFEEYEVLVGAK